MLMALEAGFTGWCVFGRRGAVAVSITGSMNGYLGPHPGPSVRLSSIVYSTMNTLETRFNVHHYSVARNTFNAEKVPV
jgi:hypothetical protein